MSLRTGQECQHVIANASTATIALVSAVATQRVYVYKLILIIGSPAVNVTLQDTSNAALSQAFQLAANGSIVIDVPANWEPWWNTGTGLGIQLFQTGTTPIGCDVWFIQAA
jgi:hypothetical protein